MPPEGLLRAVLDRSPGAAEAFVRGWWPSAVRIARSRGLTAASAEDAAQTALRNVLAWAARDGARIDGSESGFTATAVFNAARRIGARDGRQPATSTDGLVVADPNAPSPAEQAARAEQGVFARAAVARLSKKSRQIIELLYWQGRSYDQAAETLGVPVGTVKSRLHAALVELRADEELQQTSDPTDRPTEETP